MAIKLGIIGFGYMGHWHLKNAPREPCRRVWME